MALIDEPRRNSLAAHRHVLTTWGVPADELERRLAQLGLADAGVELEMEVVDDEGLLVRVAVTADDSGRLGWGVQLVQTGVGDVVLGDDGASLEGQVVELLARQGLTAGTAEPLTSGAVAERLTRMAGAGQVILGGIVSYASAVKHDLLEVPEGPVVTQDAAMAMAEGAARVLGADAAVAVTGVAGPAEMEGCSVGTVYVGSWLDGEARSAGLLLSGSPDEIRQASASHALDHLRHRLLARERSRRSLL